MRTRNASFFNQRKEWSRRKHEIFEGYLPQFSRILGRSFLVDAFAGRGCYGSGAESVAGSPLRAAEIAQKLADGSRYVLRCINVEADRLEFADLVQNMSRHSNVVHNYFGRFEKHVDAILEEVGSEAALFFLDPFGVKGLEWETLSKLGARSRGAKTELLINFNAPNFDRGAGWLDSYDQKPRAAFVRRLNRIIGDDSWQEIWNTTTSKEERYRAVVKLYMKHLGEAFGLTTAAYPVRTVESAQLKYFIVFASRHPLAMRIMSSILYGVEKRYLQDRTQFLSARASPQLAFPELVPKTLSIDELEEENIALLKEDVLAVGRGRRRISFGALQDALVAKWMGRMVEKHFRRVCRELIAEGIVGGKPTGIGDRTILEFRAA